MTKCQRRLVMEWVVGAAFLMAFGAFGDNLVETLPSWFRWVAVAAIVAIRSSAGSGAEAEGRLAINELVDEYRWLKAWAVVWALFFICAAIYISTSGHRIAPDDDIKFMIASVAIVVAPGVVLNEHRKYRECGD